VGSCENGNEPSGSIKCWEILEKLSDCQLHKKDSAHEASDCLRMLLKIEKMFIKSKINEDIQYCYCAH
jgi:hypothetical protein